MRAPHFKKWFARLPALNVRQRLRQWLSRFRGVASRYLSNYLGWHRALDGGRVKSAEQLLRLAIGVINSNR